MGVSVNKPSYICYSGMAQYIEGYGLQEANRKSIRNIYLGKYTLGDSVLVSPNECGQLCDVTPTCLGFNYYKGRGRCELLTHNLNTTPSKSRINANTDVDHYVKLDAKYTCPNDGFAHPFKARCYEVVNTPKTYLDAARHCSKMEGSLALIPNQLTLTALWGDIATRMESDSVWLGLEFQQQESYLKRGSEKSFFMWFSNMLRGTPQDNKSYCGAALKSENGKFDYYSCKTERPFVCEFRAHHDNELNELCPQDTALFDGNCYWSENIALSLSDAAGMCAERGGELAAFTSNEAIDFIGTIWEQLVPVHITESWIGLRYNEYEQKWFWSDGDEDMEVSHWSSASEIGQGIEQGCGTALRVGNGKMAWLSRDCNELHTFMCMGKSGVVMSRDCSSNECPRNSRCFEGPCESVCVCEPGYTSSVDNGNLRCLSIGKCQASGDPHYYPWDGGKIDYQGLCEHLLAGTCPEMPGDLPKWAVRVFNAHRDDYSDKVSFTMHTTIDVYDQQIKINDKGFVMYNKERRLPEFSVRPYGDSRSIEVTPINGGYKMVTDFGLSVTYKNYRVTVTAPDDYAGKTCGICGNWNGDEEDDLAKDPADWMTPGDRLKEECDFIPPTDQPCSDEKQELAEKICGKILVIPHLEVCRNADADGLRSFYESCIEDVCEADNVKEVICLTLEAIIEHCLDHSCVIDPAYRSIVGCELPCPPNSSYNPEATLDVATCQNPDALYAKSNGFGEACVCDEGYYREGLICKQDCGCLTEDGDYIEVGDYWVNKDCTIKLICNDQRELEQEPMSCKAPARCLLEPISGRFECLCNHTKLGLIEKCDQGVGDPHFMLVSQLSGEFLCYDAHGYNGDVWRIIKDENADLTVNGELFETKGSTKEDPLSYFSKIAIMFRGVEVVFTQDDIQTDTSTYSWGDAVNTGVLKKVQQAVYQVTVQDDIVMRIKRTKNPSGYILGIFLVHSDGLSAETTGVMGQFVNTDFSVEARDNSKSGLVIFQDYHQSVDVKLIKRYNNALNEKIDCWLYQASHGKDQLLGTMKGYQMKSVRDR